jgi:hypothetical protein
MTPEKIASRAASLSPLLGVRNLYKFCKTYSVYLVDCFIFLLLLMYDVQVTPLPLSLVCRGRVRARQESR